MPTSLELFLSHGSLPFTGRDEDIARLLDFWRATIIADGFRTMVVTAEAGVGKSRLVDELTTRIEEQGGSVVRMKLYPESALSLGPHLARAADATDRRMGHAVASETDDRLENAIARVRRMAHRRPTLLVLEDVHFLVGAPVAELRTIFEALADDAISMLLLARPGAGALRVAQRYLVADIALRPLDARDVASIWRCIVDTDLDDDMLTSIIDVTAGNPLAIQAALRGILAPGASSARVDPTAVVLDPALARHALHTQVRYLYDGMVAHLDARELDTAHRLAPIGEMISREAAVFVIGEAAMEELLALGILTHDYTHAKDLAGATSAELPLRFTHSLLHRNLLEGTSADTDIIISILAAEIPLHSALPLRLLTEVGCRNTVSIEMIERAVRRTLAVARALDRTPDWELAQVVWEAASAIVNARRGDIGDRVTRALYAELLRCRLELMKRSDASPEYAETIARLIDVTSDSPELGEAHLAALAATYRLRAQRQEKEWRDIWSDAQAVVVGNPAISSGDGYLMFLRDSLLFAGLVDDLEFARIVESRFDEMRHDADSELRGRALRIVGGQLLMFVETADDLERRFSLLDELEALLGRDDMSLLFNRCSLLESAGRYRELLPELDHLLELCRQQGLRRSVASYSMTGLHARLQLGMRFDDAIVSARAIIEKTGGEARQRVRASAGARFVHAALLRGEYGTALAVVDEFLDGEPPLDKDTAIVYACGLGEHPSAELDGDARDSIRGGLGREIVLPTDLMHLIACIEQWKIIAASDQDRAGVEQEIHDSVLRALDWLAGHGLGLQMAALAARCASYMPRQKQRDIAERAREIAKQSLAVITPDASGDERIHISVIGVVAVTVPGGSEEAVRGSRLRAVLGLMVADAMLDQRLGHQEFRLIASDRELDQEKSRKTMNAAVLRLREVIGRDTILTDGETPRLNESLVSVDLLTVHQRLREAESAMRQEVLVRAVPAISEALEIVARGVPFPTLYDDFFEAARDDLESRLRTAALRVSARLIDEGDHDGAVVLLRRACQAIPEDEGIAERLLTALEGAGRATEAERLRIATAGVD